jgi:hypothetical protein
VTDVASILSAYSKVVFQFTLRRYYHSLRHVPGGRLLKKLLIVGAGALAATAASLTLASTGVAGAAPPDTSGQTFSEAQASLKSAGYTAVVSTTIGDKVAQGDCTVVRQQTTMGTAFAGGGWPGKSSSPKVLLSLDCSKPPKGSSGSS